jgi:hypothetical protein
MVGLQPVDAVEVTLVVDNYVDILAARTGRRRLPLLLHPGAWRDRKVTFPTGAELHLPRPAGPTWRPKALRRWRSAAPPRCSTTRC